jgi:hypothetical protein
VPISRPYISEQHFGTIEAAETGGKENVPKGKQSGTNKIPMILAR